MAMEVESASLCNVVIKYLLDQQYLVTAFELMHELTEDGHADRATRLQQIFSDPEMYPPDEMLRLQNLQIANPQRVVEERDAAEERATIMEYELRLARDDIKRLQQKLEMQAAAPYSDGGHIKSTTDLDKQAPTPDAKSKVQNLGLVRDPLRESERMALNWAVKEYLLAAGYKLTAMTFYEEVDQDLDAPQTGPLYIPDALRHCYHLLLAASPEAIQEKVILQEEKELLLKDKEELVREKEAIVKSKEALNQEILSLRKGLEASSKEVKERDRKISEMKESLEVASKDMNGCRMEITTLKLELESLRASKGHDTFSKEDATSSSMQESMEFYKAEVEFLRSQLELAKMVRRDGQFEENDVPVSKDIETDVTAVNNSESEHLQSSAMVLEPLVDYGNGVDTNDAFTNTHPLIAKAALEHKEVQTPVLEDNVKDDCQIGICKNLRQEVETVEVLADALPKIVPYVLINHREELLPLIMCAIERHPDSSVRDLLTHTLFNLIKRPDESQRRIIMDACVTLSRNIGEERTELELLPQCWEQINHKYEERRLLVAQSCGQLAQFVKAETRTSLILSIIQQLIEDPDAVVREAASHNLAILLPCFPSTDKYFKVEELMFQLVLDPSGVVVETTLKELVPAVVTWSKNGNQPLSQMLRLLFSHILASAQRCPPVSGVEGSMEARLRVLGERERWNLDVLLRMLTDLISEVVKLAKATCPFRKASADGITELQEEELFFSESLIKDYLRGQEEWWAFDWLHVDCLPLVLQVACMLSSREDSLRSRLSKLIAGIITHFGQHYLSNIMLPIFLTAVGESTNLSHFPANLSSRVKALRPRLEIDERLATLCVLPLLLAGVLGLPSMQEHLALYLRSLVMQQSAKHGALTRAHTPELIDAVRFLCTCEEHHTVIVGVLWELVVNSNPDVKISAASIMKVLVPYVNSKIATHDVLPALVTLGSDPNLLVKYSSIEAFGGIAQHFKDEVIIDKIRVQMDAFLEDGSHEATVAVIRTLAVAVPLTTSSLRDYLLQKLLLLTGATLQGATLMRRREKIDAFCEATRALDATDLSPSNVKDLLLPVIQNLLKDTDALDPAHKEALELILRERSGGRLETITKAMGNHLSFTGVTSLFGESGFLAKKEAPSPIPETIEPLSPKQPASAQEEGRLFNRFMRGNFGDMIRGRTKTTEE